MQEIQTCIYNTTFIDPGIATDVERLIHGTSKLDAYTFSSLVSYIESIVLHDKIVYPGLVELSDESYFPMYASLKSNDVIDMEATFVISKIMHHCKNNSIVHALDSMDDLNLDGIITVFTSDRITAFTNDMINDSTHAFLNVWSSIFDKINVDSPESLLKVVSYLKHKDKTFSELGNNYELLKVICDDMNINVNMSPIVMPFIISADCKQNMTKYIYDKVADKFNVSLERLNQHQGLQQFTIPPLVAILLDRCKNREEIPLRVLEIRDDFRQWRETITKLEIEMDASATLRDKIRVLDEFDNIWTILSKTLDHKDQKLIYRIWSIIKECTPLKMVSKTIDMSLEQLNENKILSKASSFVDLWHKCMSIKNYEHLTHKVFKESISQNSKDYRCLYRFTKAINNISNAKGKHSSPSGNSP